VQPWVGGTVLGLGLLAYVGTYTRLRAAHRICVSLRSIPLSWDTAPRPFVIDRRPAITSPFRPCIAVEEWWRSG